MLLTLRRQLFDPMFSSDMRSSDVSATGKKSHLPIVLLSCHLYTLNQKVVCLKFVAIIQPPIGSNQILLGAVVAEKKGLLWVGVDKLLRVGDRGGAACPRWPALINRAPFEFTFDVTMAISHSNVMSVRRASRNLLN